MVLQNSRRAVKFYRAQEWKARMKGYIDDFKKHRIQLQEILSLYTAFGVKVLVTNVANLVSRLFETKPEWEKTLATETQNLGIGERSKWIESDASLQAFIQATDDTVLKGIVTKKVESKSKEMRDVQSKKLSELREELASPVDKICQENEDTFELKLAFHTQQLQNTIESSAQFVVRTLSGPYDRLLHEVCPFTAGFVYRSRIVFYQDLRELWKEMVSFGWG